MFYLKINHQIKAIFLLNINELNYFLTKVKTKFSEQRVKHPSLQSIAILSVN